MPKQKWAGLIGSCIMLLMAITLFGCNSNPIAGKDKMNSVAAGKDRCTDFDAFFVSFASDSVFQVKHIEFPITEYYSDEDFPLDIMERVTFDEEDHSFIDLSKDKLADKREKYPYRIEIEKVKDSIFYRQRGINNYIDVTYKFARKDNCWRLVEVRDMTD